MSTCQAYQVKGEKVCGFEIHPASRAVTTVNAPPKPVCMLQSSHTSALTVSVIKCKVAIFFARNLGRPTTRLDARLIFSRPPLVCPDRTL